MKGRKRRGRLLRRPNGVTRRVACFGRWYPNDSFSVRRLCFPHLRGQGGCCAAPCSRTAKVRPEYLVRRANTSGGDSLRASIEAGLAQSRFGVVVFSHAFFGKNWPPAELNALFAREMSGPKSYPSCLARRHGRRHAEVRTHTGGQVRDQHFDRYTGCGQEARRGYPPGGVSNWRRPKRCWAG